MPMRAPRILPTRDEFLDEARAGTIVPVRVEFGFDIDTPVTAYAKVAGGPFGFLLESVEGGERWARYTFAGAQPREAWRLDGSSSGSWNSSS